MQIGNSFLSVQKLRYVRCEEEEEFSWVHMCVYPWVCMCWPMGSLMLFISRLSCVKMLKQTAKALSPWCKAACMEMTSLPEDWASLSVTEHGRHSAQSIKQQHYPHHSCTTGNTSKQGTAHPLYRTDDTDLRSRCTPEEANTHWFL